MRFTYLPCQTPNKDLQAVVNYGFPKEVVNKDRHFTEMGTDKWAETIAWWSGHYGENVSGWWFAGGYEWCGFNDSIGKKYAAAAKSGNKKSIVAINPGVFPNCRRNAEDEDYTAGEAEDFLFNGGAMTFDVGPNLHLEEGPIGSISEAQFRQLKAIVRAVR